MKKRTVALLLALVLVIGVAAGGTIAWLTANSEQVTNTFTASDLELTIAEKTNAKDDNNNDIWRGTVVPGGEQEKDPTLTVVKGSVECYVYVLVENTMKSGTTTYVTYNINTDNWMGLCTVGDKVLYRYKTTVDAGSAAQALPVFTKVSYSGDITKDNIDTISAGTITVQGYAHHAVNTTQAVADAAAIGYFKLSTTQP